MKCPLCNVDLVMSERQGIEIDYCPQCRGVWLDRGELDKIIERAAADMAPAARQPERESERERRYEEKRRDEKRYDERKYDDYDRRRYDDDDYYKKHHKKKKPMSFLGDLFEFGDD